MFLKSHRKWTSPDLNESDVVAFWDGCIGAGIDPKRFVEPPVGLTFDRRLRNPDLEQLQFRVSVCLEHWAWDSAAIRHK